MSIYSFFLGRVLYFLVKLNYNPYNGPSKREKKEILENGNWEGISVLPNGFVVKEPLSLKRVWRTLPKDAERAIYGKEPKNC
jgi:hypothetical protein